METLVYMVRHAQSDKSTGTESSRGLSEQGRIDSRKVTARLREEGLAALYSSPYARAADTLAGLAEELGQDIYLVDDLRETHFNGENRIMTNKELDPILDAMFDDPDYAPPGGESLNACRRRAVGALKEIISRHRGESVAIGTHGLVMTLMISEYAPEYGTEFLFASTTPDIYALRFADEALNGVERLSL